MLDFTASTNTPHQGLGLVTRRRTTFCDLHRGYATGKVRAYSPIEAGGEVLYCCDRCYRTRLAEALIDNAFRGGLGAEEIGRRVHEEAKDGGYPPELIDRMQALIGEAIEEERHNVDDDFDRADSVVF